MITGPEVVILSIVVMILGVCATGFNIWWERRERRR